MITYSKGNIFTITLEELAKSLGDDKANVRIGINWYNNR